MSDGHDRETALEARLTELEIRLAHHEKMAEELSDVIAEQQKLIDRLVLEYRRALERMENVEAALDPASEPPPPHY